jgi:hypothetical protein
MARVRRAGDAELPPPTRGPEGTQLAALLRARRFRVGAGAERVAQNLARLGGEVAPDAAPYVGAVKVPLDAPSVSLGDHPGTLGPRSFGFLNNVGGVCVLDAPAPALPRKGGLALVVPRREALPDVVPLALARGLGISWIVSVGDGDPAEALAFLGADPATAAIAVALGGGAKSVSLRTVLGLKPTVVLGGDSVCRAVARHGGCRVVDDLGAFLARAALVCAGVTAGGEVSVVVSGGGRDFVAGEVERAGLRAEVAAVDERVPAELAQALESARSAGRAIVLVAGGPPEAPALPNDIDTRVVTADLRHPEHLRALLSALSEPEIGEQPEPPKARPRGNVDRELLDRVRADVDRELGDHDAKRLFKAYGARVTRQAPTSTPTGASKLAKTIGLPVVLAPASGEGERAAATQPEVKRIATLMLQESTGDPPSIFVRERFPEVPRTRVRCTVEKHVGTLLRVGEACALLPLSDADAAQLATATAARRAADQRAVAELLQRLSACAVAEECTFEAEIYVGSEPAVLTAKATLRGARGTRGEPAAGA